jgi:Arc/MetJ family transcription regulator
MERRVRTNIDIDDELMAAAMRATGRKTKKATVEEALRRVARGRLLKDLIEHTRGMGWDDGLAAEQTELAEEPARFASEE